MGTMAMAPSTENLGRENLKGWTPEIWNRVDDTVHTEFHTNVVGHKILPLYGPVHEALTVPSDVTQNQANTPLQVQEGDFTKLLEVWVEFALTKRQASEANLETAITLATRAANFLYQGVDLLIFQGNTITVGGANANALFKSNRVQLRAAPADTGLLGSAQQNRAAQPIVPVAPLAANSGTYGEGAFAGVVQAYSQLIGAGQNGPFALALPTSVFADTYRPLANTLQTPGDRIEKVAKQGVYATSALPDPAPAQRSANNPAQGLLLSLGGSTMDLVVGMDAVTAFMQEDPSGLARLRVVTRFTLRIKDVDAIVEIDFQ